MFFKIYLIAFLIFFTIDIFWLGFIANNFYNKYIGFLMKPNINWTAAILFYLLFIIGLVLFVIMPAIEKELWTHAIIFGGLFGLICYATYDLTNLATLKDWPLLVTIVDLLWGTILGALVSVISYFISIRLL